MRPMVALSDPHDKDEELALSDLIYHPVSPHAKAPQVATRPNRFLGTGRPGIIGQRFHPQGDVISVGGWKPPKLRPPRRMGV